VSVCRQHEHLLVVDCRGLHRWRYSNLWGTGSLVLAAQGTDPGLSIRPLSSRGGLWPTADIGQPADRHLAGTNTLSQIYLRQLGRPAYKPLSGLLVQDRGKSASHGGNSGYQAVCSSREKPPSLACPAISCGCCTGRSRSGYGADSERDSRCRLSLDSGQSCAGNLPVPGGWPV
jgi:hypothetical protein